MIQDYFVDTFDVLRTVMVPDGSGGEVAMEVVYSAGNRGYFESLRGNENIINNDNQLEATRLLYTKVTDLLDTDVVRYNGVVFGIVFMQHHRFGINWHVTVYLAEI